MTSYSFGDTSTALVGSALDSTSASNGAKSGGNGVYDGNRVYRRDSVLSNTHHTGDYQLHQSSHNVDSKVLHGGGTVGMSSSSSSLTDAFAGINTSSVNDNAFADYLFKQQVMSLNSNHGDASDHASPQQYHRQQPHGQHSSSDISSVVAAVAAAATANGSHGGGSGNGNRNGSSGSALAGSSDFMAYQHGSASHPQMQSCSSLPPPHSQRQHSYSAHNYQGLSSTHQSPSAAASALPGTIGMGPGAAAGVSSSATTPNSGVVSHNTSAPCLVDPLPSFLSSLPMPSSAETSKYSSMVASSANKPRGGNAAMSTNSGSDHNKENSNNMGNNGNSILAAAAAAAAAAVVSSSEGTGSGIGNILPSAASNSDLASLTSGSHPYYNGGGNNQHSHSHEHYSQSHSHSYSQQPQGHGAYNVGGLSFAHNNASAGATGAVVENSSAPPALSVQNSAMSAVATTGAAATTAAATTTTAAAAAAAVAAAALSSGNASATNPLDLNSYSISAFSRPLSQSSGTAAIFLNNGAAGNSEANGHGTNGSTSSGLVASFSGVNQAQSVVSPSQQLHGQYQYYQQQQQQRSYSDYSAYYRSPSTTLAMGAATGSTTTTGASPMSGTGIGGAAAAAGSHVASSGAPQLTAAAAAAAAAAAMGSGYYASAYQPYLRAGAGGAHSYYYSQTPARYIPYGAYPPIRHFVSPARPFKCETCEQSFSRNHDLKRHVKIHSGIKPHKCHKCGKSFGRSDALKRHSMVKRCRSTTTSASSKPATSQAAGAASAASVASQRQNRLPPSTQASQMVPGSAGGMASISNGSRLAPVNSMFGQAGAPSMTSTAGSIVSNMLSSRTNSI
ncbi:hypothetical protein H4R99_007442 [Coemansia sp. RSA 1722]|nr:hypothetical protein H4R99_007442 [Coemansia sp. RSA 1722]KAJ2601224.1 hypothetical protein GGF39_001353 [Coemansia sp. RSA 1721]